MFDHLIGNGFSQADRSGRPDGTGHLARLGHSPERIPRPEGQDVAARRSLPERIPGRIIGRTDTNTGYPVSEAHTPEDFAATIFHGLGIGPGREFHDDGGRSYRIYRGQPIRGLL